MDQTLMELGKKAVLAKYDLQKMSTQEKNEALLKTADALVAGKDHILTQNKIDLLNGEKNHMAPAMLDRLLLTKERIEAMAEGLRQIAERNDPIGEIMEEWKHANGLFIHKKRVPLGVIGIIYESRPNVTADAFGLCFKAGNAVILKGGSDAICSNIVITEIIRDALKASNVSEDAIQIVKSTDREIAAEFMHMNAFIDVLIPRGSAGLIRATLENSTIPIIQTGTGNCHVFVDESADFDMALNIIINAKTQRIGVCNACESLVIHEKIKDAFLPLLADALKKYNVEIRGDERTKEVLCECCNVASEEDFGMEYLNYIISIKVVSDIQEAILHINQYGTKHSEAIVTQNMEHAAQFQNEIDAACVYVNASTRFTDGFEFGFGAEIGISTQKLHARGPMGLKELTSYKYVIDGNGQVRP